jgi:hypothetical protein
MHDEDKKFLTEKFENVESSKSKINGEVYNEKESKKLIHKAGFKDNPKVFFIGLSPGNSFFYNVNEVEELFKTLLKTFGRENIEQIIVWSPNELYIHSLKAIGSSDPHEKALKSAKKLSLLLEEVINRLEINDLVFQLDWSKMIVSIPFLSALYYIQKLFIHDNQFRSDCLDSVKPHLQQLLKIHNKPQFQINISEGLLYLKGEFACLLALKNLSSDLVCTKTIMEKKYNSDGISPSWNRIGIIYIKQWDLLEKLLEGKYKKQTINDFDFLSFWVLE